MVYSWYTLDIDSFIEQLCENKDRPELQCNGTCYLSKIRLEKKKSNPQDLPIMQWELELFYTYEECSCLLMEIAGIKHNRPIYRCHYSGLEASYIFHPPRYS